MLSSVGQQASQQQHHHQQQQQQQQPIKLNAHIKQRFEAETNMLNQSTNYSNANKSINDSNFMNSIIYELKSIKFNETNDDTRTKPNTERAIVKSNEFFKQTRSPINGWASSNSPKSSYSHKSDTDFNSSKETLWASTQSSPNSAQRDQMRNLFKKSTSIPANLWESPNSKLSQATLMIKNDSNSSVWYTPPQIQSPAVSSNGHNQNNIWECSTSSLLKLNQSGAGVEASLLNDSDSFLRGQLEYSTPSTVDIWSTADDEKSQNVITLNSDPNSSIWSNASSIGGRNVGENNHIFTSTPYKGSNGSGSSNESITNMQDANGTNNTAASSSCLQLFSDDFVSYLNMIN